MAERRPLVIVGSEVVELPSGDALMAHAINRGNGFVSWTGEATVTSSTSVALLDSTGATLSPTKTYKVAACNIDSSAQRGAVALFVGDGSDFTVKTVYEQGTTSSNVQLYLNAGVPSVSVYGGSGSYRIPYRIEEVPNFGQALSEFGILQRLLDAPSDGTTYGRKDGAWVEAIGGGSMTYRKQATFTSSGTFTLPSTALAAVKLKVTGGGASGSAQATTDDYSSIVALGPGGGQIVNLDAVLTPGSSYTCTVGAGGAAVTALADAGTTNGNNGGNSSFGSIVTAVGGFANGRSGNGDFPIRGHEGTQNNTYSSNSYRNPPGTGGAFIRTGASFYTAISAGVASNTTAPGGGGVRGASATPVAPGAGAAGLGVNGSAGTIPGAAGGSAGAIAYSITSGAGYRGQIDIVYWDTVP